LQAAEIDRTSGVVAEELEITQLVGMAAALATGIKGIDYVADAGELKRVASQQYDIPPLAFERVLKVLEELDFVRRVERDGSRIQTFYETVPEDFDRLYDRLDDVYRDQRPTELDDSLLATVESLSMGPLPLEKIDVDPGLRPRLLIVGDAAEAVKVVTVEDTEVAYSPYFAYENPEEMGSLLARIDVERVRQSFETVRRHQGKPVLDDPGGDVLRGLIGAGLMAGPHVRDPNGEIRMFAMAPYGLPRNLLTVEKSLLDKAMAILAALRMGQTWGGATPILFPAAILRALLGGGWIARHSSTERQYSVLNQLGIVQFDDDTSRKSMRLIDTADNRRAVNVALDLLRHGEAMAVKETNITNFMLPDPAGNYRSPIQTIKPARRRTPAAPKVIADLIALAGGWKPSV
jgi:hypothetical protein